MKEGFDYSLLGEYLTIFFKSAKLDSWIAFEVMNISWVMILACFAILD